MSQPLLRETVSYNRPIMVMETRRQELSSRRRSLWALTTSLMAGTSTAVAGGGGFEPPVPPRPRGNHPAVREIHKNAWLKRQMSVDKKGTHFSKKGEKFWVVFCVHDDSEAFLEFYTEPKMGAIHKPLCAVSLNSCLHVSPSIVAGQDNEYQFAVTLQTEVIRLVAANWDQMIEWVESLQGKLREMNILSPKDNLYSKLPETPAMKIIGPVASTRDPNSPLPPTPSTMLGIGNQQLRPMPASNQNSSIIGAGRTDHLNRRSADSSTSNIRDVPPSDSHYPNPAPSRMSVNGNSSSVSAAAILSNGHSQHHHHHPEREVSRTNHNALIDLSSSSSSSDSTRPRAEPSTSPSREAVSSEGNAASQPKRKQVSVKVNVDVNTRSGNQRQPNSSSSFSATTTVVVIGNGDVRIHNNSGGEVQQQQRISRNGEQVTSSSIVVTGPNNELIPAAVSSQQQSSCHPSDNAEPEINLSSPSISRISVNCTAKVTKPKSKSQQQQRFNVTSATTGDNNGGSDMIDGIESTAESRVSNGGVAVAPAIKSKLKTAASGKKSCSTENIYEHIYIPDRRPSNNGVKYNNGNNHQYHQQQQQGKQRSQQSASEFDTRNIGIQRSSSDRSPEEEHPSSSAREAHARRLMKSSNTGSSQRSSSLGRIELLPTTTTSSSRSTTENTHSHHPREQEAPRIRNNGNRNHGWQQQQQPAAAEEHQGMMTRAIGNSTFFATTNGGGGNSYANQHQHPSASASQLQGSPLDSLIGSRSGEYRLRRDDYLIHMGESSSNGDNDNHSNHVSSSSQSGNSTGHQTNGGHLPLKEQQVIHLQKEINHPGGVRVILRKKDCLSSIAFVDYLGAVWVAGWKQTQFPVLYYGFHVGDQILKVAGVHVQSSVEASRAIKMVSSMQVEFIIKRLPFGKVFALKRSRDGEPLGLVAEGGSGEISEVLPDGIAARYGLPPKGLSVDGETPCNWYLTEVNNRPLSLMSKENEVKDRLNAVGKEISILVQPADLVKHLRKSLKSYKGFKDYVIG